MSKLSGHKDLGKLTSRSNRKGFIGAAGTLLLAACAGGALPSVNGASSKSASEPDCGGLLVARRTGPHADCGGGSGPTNISTLSNAEVAALTGAQIAALTSAQIGEFSDLQLGYITSANSFHGAQATAILQRVAASQQGAGPYPQPPNTSGTPTPPLGYQPPVAGSNFWSWFGGTIGGIVGGAVGVVTTGPGAIIISAVGSSAGATIGAFVGDGSSNASFNFWNSNTGAWDAIDLGSCCTATSETGSGQSSLDSDGVTVTGNFDASSNTVTVTVVPN